MIPVIVLVIIIIRRFLYGNFVNNNSQLSIWNFFLFFDMVLVYSIAYEHSPVLELISVMPELCARAGLARFMAFKINLLFVYFLAFPFLFGMSSPCIKFFRSQSKINNTVVSFCSLLKVSIPYHFPPRIHDALTRFVLNRLTATIGAPALLVTVFC